MRGNTITIQSANWIPIVVSEDSKLTIVSLAFFLVPSRIVLAGVAVLLFRIPLAVVPGSGLELIFAVKADIPGYY